MTLCATSLDAQQSPSDVCPRAGAVCPEGTPREIVTVATVGGSMRLDPSLTDSVWRTADSITVFRQREPLEGALATQRTVVKVARDSFALYVAVRADDDDPARIRATQLRRDADLTADDNVTIIIDSFHDRRSAFEFRTNPLGAMWDAQLSNWDTENADWNGIWEVAVVRDPHGWSALFRIPFRTLRFRAGSGTTFGFNVRRFVSRNNEEDLWRSFGRSRFS